MVYGSFKKWRSSLILGSFDPIFLGPYSGPLILGNPPLQLI